jgi:O-acetyl-ADP-ribose deacetylase (regulator of RNase III)
MAHFAEIDENNIVRRVIVVANNNTMSNGGVEDESIGEAFCQSLFGEDTKWKKTSYNGNIRYRFAAIGDTYDANRDAFIPAKPIDRDYDICNSWVLDETTMNWKAPITEPTLTDEEVAANKYYSWDESAYQEDGEQNGTGWVLITP